MRGLFTRPGTTTDESVLDRVMYMCLLTTGNSAFAIAKHHQRVERTRKPKKARSKHCLKESPSVRQTFRLLPVQISLHINGEGEMERLPKSRALPVEDFSLFPFLFLKKIGCLGQGMRWWRSWRGKGGLLTLPQEKAKTRAGRVGRCIGRTEGFFPLLPSQCQLIDGLRLSFPFGPLFCYQPLDRLRGERERRLKMSCLISCT